MNRPALLSLPAARRLALAAPAAAGLALAAAVIPAGMASAATTGCTTSASQVTCVFTENGAAQSWTVPTGVTSATFTLYGAVGGTVASAPGRGAEVTATLPVTPGTVLQVNVGQAGANGPSASNSFGGGTAGGNGTGGGGASDVRSPASDGSYPLANRLLVAGGGGGGGIPIYTAAAGSGGNADSAGTDGGSASADGVTLGGGGGGGAGTATGGGAGGTAGQVTGTTTCLIGGQPYAFSGSAGNPGALGAGGTGAGGGGGGGYYGGGGGGSGAGDGCGVQAATGGGGGGSSYTGGVSGATVTDGVVAPNDGPEGEVIISYSVPATATTLTSAPNPSLPGGQVTYTATVSPAPDGGTVAFTDGTTTIAGCGAQSVNTTTGTATCQVSYATGGSHSITAAYSGDALSGTSTSAPLTQTVNQVATTTAVTSSVRSSVYGQDVMFTATISPASGAGTPTGTVTFSDGGTTLGTGTLNSSGTATFSTSALAAGGHSITASYGGDGNFTSSTGSVTQTVNRAATTTAVASSLNPSTAGQSVTFTATITVVPPGGGTPTGTVTFSDGGTTLGTGTLNSSGTATFSTSALAAGGHSITASYGGDGNFTSSTGSVTQTVSKIATSTTVASSANPSIIGGPVTYTATVSPASGTGTPTGTLAFSDGGSPIAGCGAVTVSSTGTATCPVTYTAAGSHTITAAYSGDATYAASTSAGLTQQVAYQVQLQYNPAKASTSGATIPVKIQLLNAAGTNMSAAGITVTVTGQSPSPAPGKAPTGTFTYQMLDQGPGYQLNVKTTGYPAGTYTLSFTVSGDPTVHTAQFVIS